jgi:antibiotic biosynthesis monooxygenase (ABM) superfamily enzyme
MTTVVAQHAVGDMRTWLAGGDERKALFKGFSSSHQIFKHASKNQVCVVLKDVDLEKMKAMMNSPETAARKAEHTVIDPVEMYIEIDGGT